MENKYFTPDIEDFYVGVVYEKFSQGLQIDEFGRFLPEGIRDDEIKWRECTIKYPSDILHVSIALDKETIRVPYLTKEQIEGEGWEYKNRSTDLWFERKEIFLREDGYHLENIKLQYGLHDYRLKISFVYIGDGEESTGAYLGECKDINTFRKIIKLLEI